MPSDGSWMNILKAEDEERPGVLDAVESLKKIFGNPHRGDAIKNIIGPVGKKRFSLFELAVAVFILGKKDPQVLREAAGMLDRTADLLEAFGGMMDMFKQRSK